jgi:hypothetical protein
MTEKPVKRFELCTERLETLEDVKKILKALQIRLDTDNPLYEELKEYFVVEVVPPGYFKLYEKVGSDEIHKMTYEEIERMGSSLLSEPENNEE